MGLLRCEGVFSVPVPAGWEVVGVPGDWYRLTPPSGPGECRLVVLPRGEEPLADGEGYERLGELLDELGVDRDREDLFVRLRETAGAHRALAWFEGYDEDGHDIDCLAAAVTWPGALVVATALSTPRAPAVLAAAELIVASITPYQPGPPRAARGRRGHHDG